MVIFAIFFALGIWLLQQQSALPTFDWAWLLLGFPFVLLLPTTGRTWRVARALLIAISAFGIGYFHAAWQGQQRLSEVLPDAWQGRDIAVLGVVAELPRSHERGLRFRFNVERTLTPNIEVPKHVYLSTYQDDKNPPLALHAGERWQLTLRLKQPHGTANPHGFDFEAWALERDIRAVGYVHGKGNNQRLDALAEGWNYRIEHWREVLRDKFSATLGVAPYAGVLIALAIGDQNSIPPAQWQIFTRTGISHLVSISGLHITMLASLAFALSYRLWRRSARLTLRLPARKAAATAAVLAASGYALLSGFAIPAQRTVYMVCAVALALWLRRNFAPGQLLAIALIAVLGIDPWAVIAAGFWLSFGAVALILYVTSHRIGASATREEQPFHFAVHLPHILREYGTVQWAMTIGLTPLLLGLFQQVSLVSPIANAFAIPLLSLVVVPLALLGAALPSEVPLWLAHMAMEATMIGITWLSALPQAVWAQHAPPVWSVVAGMCGAVWLLLPRGFPARWLGVLMMLPMFVNRPESPDENSLRMVVFDVGQGLSVAVQTRDHALLYDTGPDYAGEADSGNRILVPTLHALGISELDGLMLSHDDLDHIGGTTSVLQSIPVSWVSSSLPAANSSLVLAEMRRCRDGQQWHWNGVSFEVLHPVASDAASRKRHDNEMSCVLRISIGARAILLTGDIEQHSEARLLQQHRDKLSADVLIAPHHGSKSSSTDAFVAAVLPNYVVFTAGYRNRFNHPHPDVQQRYLDSGAELLRSDDDGAILIEMDAQQIRLERYRKMYRRYWTHRAARDDVIASTP